MRRVLATVTTIGCLGFTAACGGDTTETGGGTTLESSPTGSASPAGTTSTPAEGDGTRIEITISGHDVSPSGERVQAEAGEPVVLAITADAPGELHVHSSPEQEISYPKGKSVRELVIERPGVVEVESHDAHSVIVQLEVH